MVLPLTLTLHTYALNHTYTNRSRKIELNFTKKLPEAIVSVTHAFRKLIKSALSIHNIMRNSENSIIMEDSTNNSNTQRYVHTSNRSYTFHVEFSMYTAFDRYCVLFLNRARNFNVDCSNTLMAD